MTWIHRQGLANTHSAASFDTQQGRYPSHVPWYSVIYGFPDIFFFLTNVSSTITAALRCVYHVAYK